MTTFKALRKSAKQAGSALVLCVAFSVFFLPAAIASAETLSPWWGVKTNDRPTNLTAGVAQNDVQQLTVTATAGEFELYEERRGNQGEIIKFNPRSFAWDAPAQTVQEGLREIYPGNEVEVSGGPQGGTLKPYIITFPGQPSLNLVGVSNAALVGEINIRRLSEGRPDGQVVVMAENRGDESANGEATPIEISDRLPAGVEAVAIEGIAHELLGAFKIRPESDPLSCSLQTLSCVLNEAVPPYAQIEVRVSVIVKPVAVSGTDVATVSGGGAARAATVSSPVTVSSAPTPFGVEDYQLIPENADGTLDTQAGSHPFQLTSVVTLNQTTPTYAPAAEETGGSYYLVHSAGLPPKDIVAELPTGLVGNPTPFTQCTDAQFSGHPSHGNNFVDECPVQSVLGVASVTYSEPHTAGTDTTKVPIFNMVPLPGEPARFGFLAGGLLPVILDTSVRTGSDYGVTVSADNITQVAGLASVTLTFWGVPGDPRHNASRGWNCLNEGKEEFGYGPCINPAAQQAPPPFLVMPTSCQAPYQSTVHMDSWTAEGRPAQQATPLSYTLGGLEPVSLDGCNHLPFAPSISAAPDVSDGSTPSGLTTDVHVPQTAELNPEGLAESSVKDISVTLPQGVALNPAGADGLEACSEAEIGFLGEQPGEPETKLFSPALPEPFCSNAAKIATAKIKTPLLPNALEGAVYLGTPAPNGEAGNNPFNSLIAMYLVAEDPVSGTLVKLPGEVQLCKGAGEVVDGITCQGLGQITATFKNSPELPFEDAELHFFGGERAPLATPAHCGTYTTAASFVPWSGNAPVASQSSFQVTSGPNGSACPGAALPFSPSLTAGTTNIQAGAFSPFTMTMSREDGQQSLKSIELHMPPGLSGVLTGIPLCGEAQGNAGTCPAASEIGETTVSVGLGGNPYTVTGGQVFLTGPYEGAPFGLSIVNPAVAGPFNLGKVIVRAKLEVNPITTAVTVTSDSSGPYAIPPSIDGIPLEIKHVNVTINRGGGQGDFTFNPTSCNAQQITGNLQSIEGGSASLSVPFQPTNCATLKFAPKFAVSTSGKTSRANGASLAVKLTYPSAPFGSQANIARVKVDLPKQLPSRLTTLQKACTAAQFNTNPAGCPAASFIGHAKAVTPLVPVPLEGPAIFVSHGGEAFPSLIIVLQGYGVTLDLVGSTFISKAGITSSTFKTVPDAPVGSFELNLPVGKFSALAANGNLCKSKLAMPTEFVAQNGAKINESTDISVSGCSTGISIVSHKIKGRTLTVSVSVPAAGILTASGKGLSASSKSAKGRETLTFKLAQKKPGKLSTKLKIAFKPSKGSKQARSLSVKFKR